MVKCPYCNEQIEDDSCYCDQCGGLLYVCPNCKKIGRGKGKRCGACGTALVSAVELISQDQGQNVASNPASSSANSTPNSVNSNNQNNSNQNGYTPPQFNSGNNQSSNNFNGTNNQSQQRCVTTDELVKPTALEFAPMGIILNLAPGNVIGRTTGPYSGKLSQCIYISGTHAKVDFDGRKWTITDLGSRNGTKVNGVKCTPTLQFKVGDTVRLGNFYDFKVI